MPDSAPHAIAPVHAKPIAAPRAASREAPQAIAAWRTTTAEDRPVITPSVFTIATDDPNNATPRASKSVHNGAVDPATGTPGLYEKPAPSAMFRAKCRWIQESSSGNPGTPARRCSISAKTATGRQPATATTRSSHSADPRGSARGAAGTARRLLADHGVAGVAHRLLAHGEHVEKPAVRNLDLG